MDQSKRYQAAKRITLIGAAVNAILAIIKVAVGYVAQSHALVADGIHSASDLLTDVLVLLAAKFGFNAADRDHPYGHARIETAATVALAILISVAGAGIAYEAVQLFIAGDTLVPGRWALAVAALSVAANEGLYQWTMYVAKQIRSNMLKANAWHHRSDAASSVVVFIGVLGALFGAPYLDAIAALIVGVMVIKMGINLAWQGICELIDTGVEEDTLADINRLIIQTDGVKALHQLRTRSMAGAIFLDVHILVDQWLSVSEGHHISARVERRLLKEISKVVDVVVHVDVEDDETHNLCLALPSRTAVTQVLDDCWAACPGYAEKQRLTLHYVSGTILVDIRLPLSLLDTHTAQALQITYHSAIESVEAVSDVTILWV